MDNLGLGITAVVALPFVLVALFLIAKALSGRRQANAAKSWPTTVGQVLMSRIETRRSHSSQSGTTTSYYPDVVYTYQVDGQTFQSNRLNFSKVGRGNYRAVEKQIAQYPPGGMIQVYYNPANPAEAVLEPTAPASGCLLFVAFFIFVILIVTVGITLLMNNVVSGILPSFK